MKARLKNAGIFFLVQLFNYYSVAVFTRFVAQADYVRSCSLDFMYALVNYYVIRRIAKSDEDAIGLAGYVIGSVLGTFLGIWTTLRMVGH